MRGGCVNARNTLSSRPDSRCSSGTSQSFSVMSALTADKVLAPGFGTAVSRSSRASDSTSATYGSRAILARAASSSAGFSKRRLTA